VLHKAIERESDLSRQKEPVFVEGGLLRLAVVVVSTGLFYWLASTIWNFVF
jgi:hypothetical protein